MAVITRAGKGSELTYSEVDTNWTDLVAAVATKQDTLVSATNIKTINGTTILGAGDLAVTGESFHPFMLMGA